MRTNTRALPTIAAGALLATLIFGVGNPVRLAAKDKGPPPVAADDPTLRLYDLLNSKYNGKLDDFYLLADTFSDPDKPGQTEEHVLRIEYDKSKPFGKLKIYIRTVDQLTPEQLKAYSPKDVFAFAESESEKFTKTDPGSFGRGGDIYFQPTSPGGPLGTSPVTDDVQARYDRYVTQYIMPALEKKAAGGAGS
jgi:hypothetical protein